MRKVIFSVLLALQILLVMACQSNPTLPTQTAEVRRVVSGQSLDILVGGSPYRLRLAGILIPSFLPDSQKKEAQQFLSLLLTDNSRHSLSSVTVTVEANWSRKDKFGRISGYVWHNGHMVNEKILKEGWAVVFLDYTGGEYDQRLLNAQNYARVMEKGIWGVGFKSQR